MADAPDNLIFEYLRQLDAKLDRIIEDIGGLNIRMPVVEERLARTNVALTWNCRLREPTAVSISRNYRAEDRP